MLRALNIRDFVIVDRMDLEFDAGFTVLTGETGAGKSILIDALAMVLGERGDAGIVRQGSDKSEISAEFGIAALEPLQRWLIDNDLGGDDGECLMRRVIDSGGRSRAFINGRACTLQQLREAGEHLVDIYGQHEHQSLMRAAAQRALLDAYAGLNGQAGAVAAAWRRWQDIRMQLTALETNAAAFAAEREQLEWQVRELDALKFSLEEWQELLAEHTRLAHAQSLIEGVQYAMDVLSEGDNSSVTQLVAVSSRLDHLLEYDARLKDIIDVIASAQAQAQEAVYMLRDYQQRLDVDPQRFTQVEQRLDAVHTSARKYRATAEMLPDALARARQRLEELGGSGDVETVCKREAEAHDAYLSEARKLGAGRKIAARKLSEKVTEAMQTLAMAGGSFEVALAPLAEGNSNGLEQIEFLVAAHKDIAPRPMAKVASGGELSRISLVIQTVTSETAEVPTLIFDEVDAGIGGRVAEIVGRMLKKLGRKHQVMCVTHLPQVAASADQQWQVTKTAANARVLSHVTVLDDKQRVEEIARMLGGVKITATTRKHAAEMLRAVNGK
ncbi:MAG: DNA repair protein RecN [Betaproteobacteria bacterium]|nr:DNA repair protein RecN [Betaproteobacteria bacterium]